MANYLVTGVSGTGKSSVAEVLGTKGYIAIDADRSTYSHWVDRQTNQSLPSRPRDVDWIGRFDWLWREEEMGRLLDQGERHDQFICGTSANQSRFYARFKNIFLLTCAEDVIVDRLKSRNNNPFGKREGDIEKVLSWKDEFEKEIKQSNVTIIDTSQMLTSVVDKILSDIHEN